VHARSDHTFGVPSGTTHRAATYEGVAGPTARMMLARTIDYLANVADDLTSGRKPHSVPNDPVYP